MFLSEEEIVALTGYKRRGKQADWLQANGFNFHLRGDGGIAMSRSHVEDVLSMSTRKRRPPQPDFTMFN